MEGDINLLPTNLPQHIKQGASVVRSARGCIKHDSTVYNHSASHSFYTLPYFLGTLCLWISLFLSMYSRVWQCFCFLRFWQDFLPTLKIFLLLWALEYVRICFKCFFVHREKCILFVCHSVSLIWQSAKREAWLMRYLNITFLWEHS